MRVVVETNVCIRPRRMIAENRSLVPQATEDLLRYEPVAGTMPCLGRDGVTFRGVDIPPGENRRRLHHRGEPYPEHSENPESRPPWAAESLRRAPAGERAPGYGIGAHSCLGVQMARLEGRVWLNKVHDRTPEGELAFEDIDYGINIMSRGPEALPLVLA